MDKKQAMQATKTGAICACISAFLTFAVSFYAISNNSSDRMELWNDPSVFFDVVLIFILAFGIYKKSLTAAIVMLVYFIFAKIMIAIETGRGTGILMALVFLYFYGKAVQGAFVLQKIEKAENPSYQAKSRWMKFSIIAGVVIMSSLAGMGLLSMTGMLTPTEVLEGKDLSEDYREALINSDIINEDDSIQYFYSEAFSSIVETGSILTSDRVIS